MSTTTAGTAREGTGVMDTTETTRLRALCERAALPACEAQHMRDDGAWCVVAAQGERRAIIAEVTWALPEPLASDRVTAARAKLYAEAPAAIPALCDALDARDRELAAVTAERDQLVADAAATAARSVEEWADVARLVGLDRTALPVDVRRAVEHEIAERDAARDALDHVTAERDALLALAPHPSKRTGIRCARCGRDGGVDCGDALPVCDVCSDAVTVERERDDLRAVLETRNAEITLAHERIAELRRAVAAEREACAALAEDCIVSSPAEASAVMRAAKAIRARGEGGK